LKVEILEQVLLAAIVGLMASISKKQIMKLKNEREYSIESDDDPLLVELAVSQDLHRQHEKERFKRLVSRAVFLAVCGCVLSVVFYLLKSLVLGNAMHTH